ncbi:MAG: tRNA (adenosine(37)-N6)-threonylcarbamoyltransferase complex dimerization subunit type 1 TsaB [Oscillospiraceae bacterium]|jgi:tRNA threonylcarbamoyladenosine biosynthesis protein TsaB|nr:tRNA (adenosine(37)-N6)-threonylcarbamoyltransferase complex dimerization subunit type 1 TsaB [Oscillospiraceae bacterium]
MTILGLDSSAVSASCAVCEVTKDAPFIPGGKILAVASVNVPVTHSETLLPLTESVLRAARLSFDDIDAFAVSSGPGSFTGLRVSVSAVKGLAFSLNKPVCGVSTLLSLAYNLMGRDVIACPVMDARRNVVYNALFDVSGGSVERLTPDRAVSLDELGVQLSQFTEKEIVFVGDGALLAHNAFDGACSVASEITRCQNAASVCFAAIEGEFVPAKNLMPVYIRKPQAERERES